VGCVYLCGGRSVYCGLEEALVVLCLPAFVVLSFVRAQGTHEGPAHRRRGARAGLLIGLEEQHCSQLDKGVM
jgi:hypothetical protein